MLRWHVQGLPTFHGCVQYGGAPTLNVSSCFHTYDCPDPMRTLSSCPGRSSLAETAPQLAAQYTVPHLFRHDLFSCLGYKREDHRQANSSGVNQLTSRLARPAPRRSTAHA